MCVCIFDLVMVDVKICFATFLRIFSVAWNAHYFAQKECEIGRPDFSTTKINLNLMHGIYNDLMDLQQRRKRLRQCVDGQMAFRKIACETKTRSASLKFTVCVCVSVIKSKEPVLLNLIKWLPYVSFVYGKVNKNATSSFGRIYLQWVWVSFAIFGR